MINSKTPLNQKSSCPSLVFSSCTRVITIFYLSQAVPHHYRVPQYSTVCVVNNGLGNSFFYSLLLFGFSRVVQQSLSLSFFYSCLASWIRFWRPFAWSLQGSKKQEMNAFTHIEDWVGGLAGNTPTNHTKLLYTNPTHLRPQFSGSARIKASNLIQPNHAYYDTLYSL